MKYGMQNNKADPLRAWSLTLEKAMEAMTKTEMQSPMSIIRLFSSIYLRLGRGAAA